MKTIPILALLVAVGAAAVGTIALLSDDEGETLTLTYTEPSKGGEFHAIGNVPQGEEPDQPGTGFALSIPLQDEGGEDAGSINATCINVNKDFDGQCSGTAILPDGELVLNVTGPLEEDVAGSIVGGRGDYEGAYGTFESIGGEGDSSTDTFEFTIP